MYPYNSEIRLGQVALYVNNLDKLSDFYTKDIGFTLKEKSVSEALLTFENSDEVALKLIKTDVARERSYGLYHMAILLKERSNLADSLYHLLKNKVPLEGGADHGYSEAVYLQDPEGNGIEIYFDKDESVWDIREDGKIVGVTEELDVDAILKLRTHVTEFKLNAEAKIGHIHLNARYAVESSKVYQEVLELGDKLTFPTASFIASGYYHHHIALNNWAGHNLQKKEANAPGLDYFTIVYSDKETYERVVSNAKEKFTLIEENQGVLVEDSDGIRIKIELEK